MTTTASTAPADVSSGANKRAREAEAPAAEPVMSSPKLAEAPQQPKQTSAKVTPVASADETTLYKARMNQFKDACEKAGKKYVLFKLPCTDELLREALARNAGVEDFEDLEEDDESFEETIQKAKNQMTQEQVDSCLNYGIVEEQVLDLVDKYANAILYADTRYNSPGDGMLMLNTYSSYMMYPVIEKQLTAAVKAINKATREVKKASADASKVVPNVAKEALKLSLAVVLASDSTEHWLQDTEEPERCDAIAKKMFTQVIKDLLWFEDSELGLVDDGLTRKSLVKQFETIRKDWGSFEWIKMPGSFRTPKNGQGMGRAQAVQKAPPQKKAKTTATVFGATSPSAADAAPGSTGAGGVNHAASFISAIDNLVDQRVKTQLQITIRDMSNRSKAATVVLSGATSMKKLGQLCAYLTKNASEYHFHSQKGKSLKDSYFKLNLRQSTLVIGEKKLAKMAAKENTVQNPTAHIEDKGVKIVQCFQGLTIGKDTGIVYDSQDARKIGSAEEPEVASLQWYTPGGQQAFVISVQGILPNKVAPSQQPLPRLVDEDAHNNSSASTGFGMRIHSTNRSLCAGRQGPSFIVFGGTSQASLNAMYDNSACRPVCRANGSNAGEYYFWQGRSKAEIEKSGLPASVTGAFEDGKGYLVPN